MEAKARSCQKNNRVVKEQRSAGEYSLQKWRTELLTLLTQVGGSHKIYVFLLFTKGQEANFLCTTNSLQT